MIKSIITRFVKGAIAGAITAMMIITFNVPTAWGDIYNMLNTLAIVGTYGAITGFLLAVQKWASWKE
jgi:hypothetical protein